MNCKWLIPIITDDGPVHGPATKAPVTLIITAPEANIPSANACHAAAAAVSGPAPEPGIHAARS